MYTAGGAQRIALRVAHSNPNRKVPFRERHHQIPAPEPESPFDLSDIKFEEIRAVVRKALASQQQDLLGTIYKVYKNSPTLLTRLCKLLRKAWKKKQLPSTWTLAEGCFVPREPSSV